jgi:hypothetical protein
VSEPRTALWLRCKLCETTFMAADLTIDDVVFRLPRRTRCPDCGAKWNHLALAKEADIQAVEATEQRMEPESV